MHCHPHRTYGLTWIILGILSISTNKLSRNNVLKSWKHRVSLLFQSYDIIYNKGSSIPLSLAQRQRKQLVRTKLSLFVALSNTPRSAHSWLHEQDTVFSCSSRTNKKHVQILASTNEDLQMTSPNSSHTHSIVHTCMSHLSYAGPCMHVGLSTINLQFYANKIAVDFQTVVKWDENLSIPPNPTYTQHTRVYACTEHIKPLAYRIRWKAAGSQTNLELNACHILYVLANTEWNNVRYT